MISILRIPFPSKGAFFHPVILCLHWDTEDVESQGRRSRKPAKGNKGTSTIKQAADIAKDPSIKDTLRISGPTKSEH